jgi:hypothetical protein
MTCHCGNISENKETGDCASCSHEKRKSLRGISKQKKIFQIKKQSTKRTMERPEYTKMAKEHLKQHPDCQIMLLGCTKKATQVHHSKKRGFNYLNREFFMSACHQCHHQIEFVMSAKERRERGFLK